VVRGRRRIALAGALLASLVLAPAALADGTETLGPPSIAIGTGTDVKVAGVGNHAFPGTPTSFNADIPANAIVKQVLLYWTGHVSSGTGPDQPDFNITVNGNAVQAQSLIGGPTNFFLGENFYTYRADITSLNLIQPGSNVLTVSDMHYPSAFAPPSGNDGAGVVIVFDDGTPSTFAGIRDGQDLAFAEFAPPLDATVPQTFSFNASNVARSGSLGLMAGSVRGADLNVLRGNVVRGQFDTGQSFTISNPLQSNQGFEFDAVNLPVTVPAGATSVTVQLFSEGGDRPASLSWITATLMMDEPPPPPAGGQGCTPGYWKNHTESWPPTGFSPSQALSTVFSPTGLGTLASDSLLTALKYKGGSTLTEKKQILLRAAVASLLNSAHSGVSFGMTTAEVISAVNAALASNDATTIIDLATELDDLNNGGCPLN
jgi:hypothetical protein